MGKRFEGGGSLYGGELKEQVGTRGVAAVTVFGSWAGSDTDLFVFMERGSPDRADPLRLTGYISGFLPPGIYAQRFRVCCPAGYA